MAGVRTSPSRQASPPGESLSNNLQHSHLRILLAAWRRGVPRLLVQSSAF